MRQASIALSWLATAALLFSYQTNANSEVPVSCECPKLDCGPCMEEQGLTFYSEKCGKDGAQVKSCARPTCAQLESPPAACKEANKAGASATPVAAKAQPAADQRTPASAAAEVRGPVIGTIHSIKGTAWMRLPDGSRQPAAVGTEIHEKDTVLTDKDGLVQVDFSDGNIVHVQSDSTVKVQQYDSTPENKKAIIDLIRGKVRNQVRQKYNGQTTFYQIRTRAAVAGVRGTDFVASYNEGEKIETKIETIEGKVVLANLDFSQSLEVEEGHAGAYVVASNAVFGQDEINEFVARGYMTPVYKMSDAEIAKLNADTLNGAGGGRMLAAKGKKANVCSEPKADLNQCLWHCENNPKGDKICRTDLPQVNCVRKRCNANGEWAEETRLPASFSEQCKPSGNKIGPCDY